VAGHDARVPDMPEAKPRDPAANAGRGGFSGHAPGGVGVIPDTRPDFPAGERRPMLPTTIEANDRPREPQAAQ